MVIVACHDGMHHHYIIGALKHDFDVISEKPLTIDSDKCAAIAQAEYARTVGIKIVLEMPHVWDLYYNVERSKQMLSYLQSDNVGVILDSTHWHTSSYDIDDYVKFLQDRLWHIHLRDAAGKDSPAGNYELEKTPGKGEVDFKLLGETLDKYGYSGHVTLETEYKNYKDPAEVDNENAYAIGYLKSIGWDVADNG